MNLKSENGQYLLRPLFWETSTPSSRLKFQPLYTFKEDDYTDSEGNVYRSLYQIYMACDSEYDVAMETVNSLYHWDKLCATKWFMEGFDKDGKVITMGLKDWREHKRREEESLALAQIKKQAKSGNLTAQKYLHQGVTPKAKKVGPKPHGTKGTADDELDSNIAQFLNRQRG